MSAHKLKKDSVITIVQIAIFITATVVFTYRYIAYRNSNIDISHTELLEVGDSIPRITFQDERGNSLNTSTIEDQVAYVIFGNCGTCEREIPFWNDLYMKIKSHQLNGKIIGLWVSGKDHYNEFIALQSVEIPVYFVDTITKYNKLRVKFLTQIYVVDEGIIKAVYVNPSIAKDTKTEIMSIFGIEPQ